MSPTSKAPRKKYGRRLLTARSRGDIGSTTAMPPTGRWGLRGGTKISTMRVWVDIVGHVVEISPPRHLVLTWAFPKDVKDPDKVSRVTFDIETYGDGVRLTVTHSDLEPDSAMLQGITRGWPLVLSSLKTLLETGKPLPGTSTRMTKPPE